MWLDLAFNMQEEYSQEQLAWIPIYKMCSESCLDFLTAKPHGLLCILDDQTSLAQVRSSQPLRDPFQRMVKVRLFSE